MEWRALSIKGAEAISRKLGSILESWRDTPYLPGQQAKGAGGGVDCVRFVCGVVDELYGFRRAELPRLPQDRSLHDRAGAVKAMKFMRRLYEPNLPIEDGVFEPGDILVVSAPDGGPGHAMIVGAEPNTLWHSTGRFVQMTGIGFLWATYHSWKFCGGYRMQDREKWA